MYKRQAKFFAAATVLLVLEITRRTTGWALVIVASTLILYAFFGDMLPRAVKHTGFTFDVIVEHLFLLNEGVYGIPIGVATVSYTHLDVYKRQPVWNPHAGYPV